jgi:3-methyladenine DNA glycosylase AlkD
MNKYHQEILTEIKKKSGTRAKYKDVNKYVGSQNFFYPITIPEMRAVAKEFVKSHPELDLEDLIELLNELFRASSYTEKVFASKLLEYYPKLRKKIDPELLNGWLDYLSGWAEIDSLCQSCFTGKELIESWKSWEKLLKKFVKDKNISKRRASIVLLTMPVSQSSDERLSQIAFENIDILKVEKDILITKAISWILRSLIKHHRKEVEMYLKENGGTLPKVALRETNRKLKTGRK